MIESVGGDRMGQDPLPPIDAHPAPPVINGVTAYKDAKLCLVWRAWDEAFPDAKWIIVRRNAESIAESCLRTPFMRAHSTKAGWLQWVEEHVRRFDQMKEQLDVIEIWTDTEITEGYRQMIEFCSLDYNESAVRREINPELFHA